MYSTTREAHLHSSAGQDLVYAEPANTRPGGGTITADNMEVTSADSLLDALLAGGLASTTLYKMPRLGVGHGFVAHVVVSSALIGVSTFVAIQSSLPSSFAVLRLLLAILLQDVLIRSVSEKPWGQLCHWIPMGAITSSVLVQLLFGSPRDGLGLMMFVSLGDVSICPATFGLAALTISALIGWSWYVKGKHGPVQSLDEILSPTTTLLPLAFMNAFAEEYEFRVLLQSAFERSVSTGATDVCLSARSLWAIVLSNVLFGAVHVRGGFPRGKVGFVLVLFWGSALGLLKCVSGGMLQPYLIHVIADIVIFVLIYANRRRQRATKTR